MNKLTHTILIPHKPLWQRIKETLRLTPQIPPTREVETHLDLTSYNKFVLYYNGIKLVRGCEFKYNKSPREVQLLDLNGI